MSDLELPFRRLDNSRKYRAKIRLLDGRTVDVRSTTDSPDSSYGLQCWVDRRGNSYGQIDLINPLVAVYDIEDITDAVAAASTLGRKGGRAKSEAKAAASRENGKKGGRPRKKQTSD